MIRNKGIADPSAFTLLGVSTTRYSNNGSLIGQFGSGAKHSVGVFLRHNTQPIIITDRLKMEFFSKPKFVGGNQYDQVCVKYSGVDQNGNNHSSTDDLGYTLQWGVSDWTKCMYGFREFVANAIDGATISGGDYRNVEIETVEKPRAKSGFTSVFLPFNDHIQECWSNIGTWFLHFSNPQMLNKRLISKHSDSNETLVYKKGVLVCSVSEPSIFNYNLDDSLRLDESRNAQTWAVRAACAEAVSNAPAADLVRIFSVLNTGKKCFESKLESHLVSKEYHTAAEQKETGERFKLAFETTHGKNAVACSGTKCVKEFVERKGFKPVVVEDNWFQTLEKLGIPTESKVLSGLEKEGLETSEASPDMLRALNMIWELLQEQNMLNGRKLPPVKGFNPLMSGEAQTYGMYKEGVVYIHEDLSTLSPLLLKVMLEEVVHHVTDAGDMSRDLQDFLFRLVIKLVFKEGAL
jgi:hypothetical protein